MAIRTATGQWDGDLRDGDGSFSSASGALDGKYSFESRFGETGGTNPEELVAAAHASCFSMFLAGVLSDGGNTPESIRTEANVQILKDGEGFTVTRIDLATVGRVPGVDEAGFEQAAQIAKENCPISKLLGAVPEMNVDAKLESS
jgi:osmotically inducible protein OsmC